MADWAEKLAWGVCLESGKASVNRNGNPRPQKQRKWKSERMATWRSSSSEAVAVQTNKLKTKQRNKEKPWQGQELGRQEAMVNAPPCSGCRPGKIKMKILLPYQMGNEEAKNKRRCRPRNTKINSAKWQINKEARYKEEMM